MDITKILSIIRSEAEDCDKKAEEACKKSKYSIQDYWMCVEYRLQRLHDRIAKESGQDIRCPHYPFRVRLAEFRKATQNESS